MALFAKKNELQVSTQIDRMTNKGGFPRSSFQKFRLKENIVLARHFHVDRGYFQTFTAAAVLHTDSSEGKVNKNGACPAEQECTVLVAVSRENFPPDKDYAYKLLFPTDQLVLK